MRVKGAGTVNFIDPDREIQVVEVQKVRKTAIKTDINTGIQYAVCPSSQS